MEELKILLQEILNKDLQQIILSNSRHPEQVQKAKIRPVLIRGELVFQDFPLPADAAGAQIQRKTVPGTLFYPQWHYA